MADKKISDLPAGGDPQDTDEFVVARGATNVSLAWSSLSNAATRNNVALTLDGNTSGMLALVSSGTLTLAGGNNITVSQVGNAVTISGASIPAESQTFIGAISASDTLYTSGTVRISGSNAATVHSGTGQLVVIDVPVQSVQPETQTFIGGISASDTLYTSGTVRITGVGGGVTVSSNTGQRIDISVAAQSVQPETQTFVGGVANSETTYTSGTVNLSGLGNVTVRSTTGNAFQISVPAQSVQPETQTFVGGIGNSQTTYTSGTINLSVVAGNLTIRSTTGNAFQFSASQSVQAETQTFVGGIANSQTTYTSGTVSLSELGAITIRSTTGNQYQLSVNSQTVQTQGVLSAGVSTGGNTAGNTTVNTGSRFVLVASGNATASQATAAGASTVTISVGTQTVQTQGVLSAGVSNVGNSSGDTTVNTGSRLVLAGGNNITLSQGTAAGATTITISAPNLGAGAMSAGVSNLGNTAGSTGVTGTRLVLVGTNNVTLSQSTDANGGTVSISAAGGGAGNTLSYFNPQDAYVQVAGVHGQGTLHMQPMQAVNVQFDRVVIPIINSFPANTSVGSHTLSYWQGLYTRNVSTLSLLSSWSSNTQFTVGTTNSSLFGSLKLFTIATTGTITEGQYWMANIYRTSASTANWTFSQILASQQNSNLSGMMGVANAASVQYTRGLGTYSATTSALPVSIAFSQLTGTGSLVLRQPVFYFVSETV